MNWMKDLMDEYYTFLKEKTIITQSTTGWVTISTPFLNMFNDSIEIYAKKDNGKILLSDDGNTLKNLDYYGVSFSRSPKRKEFLENILLNYGISIKNQELLVETNELNFPQKKLNLLSAISEANDLYSLSKQTVNSVFKDDVKSFLDEQDLIYTSHFISKGSVGLEFTFDFQIAYRKTEIVIKAFNSVNKMNLPQFLFTWEDIQKVRERLTGKKVLGLAMINDIDKEVNQEYIEALDKKNTLSILWSERHKPQSIQKLKEAA